MTREAADGGKTDENVDFTDLQGGEEREED